MGLNASNPKMPRPSRLEAFLKFFPEDQRSDIEGEILRCSDSKSAHLFLKSRYKYRGSYDSVKFWRKARSSKGVEGLGQQATEIAQMATRMPLESNPVASSMDLALRLNNLCHRLLGVLEQHDWVEPGEFRLTPKQASQLVSCLPGLVRASSGVILEMHRVQTEIDQKTLMLATIEELAIDWRQMLEHDNPELLPLLESAAQITKARLELSRSSLLERQMQ
jgi:hypothetical protein